MNFRRLKISETKDCALRMLISNLPQREMEEGKKEFLKYSFFVLNIRMLPCILVMEFESLFGMMPIKYKGHFLFIISGNLK